MGKTDTKVKDRELLEEIGGDLLSKMTDISIESTEAFKAEGMIVVPVKYKDGSFKNKTIGAKWEFFPNYVYVGARGDLIFGMISPDQEQERDSDGNPKPMWETAEFNLKKLDDTFPLLLSALMKKCEVEKSLNLMSELVDLLYSKRAVATAMEMETAEEKLQANPMFGLF